MDTAQISSTFEPQTGLINEAQASAAPLPRHAEPQGHGGAALTQPILPLELQPPFAAAAA